MIGENEKEGERERERERGREGEIRKTDARQESLRINRVVRETREGREDVKGRGETDPQESGENKGGRETRVFPLPPLSIHLFLPSSVSYAQMCQGKAEGGEVSPAGFWPRHSQGKATAERKVASAVGPRITSEGIP